MMGTVHGGSGDDSRCTYIDGVIMVMENMVMVEIIWVRVKVTVVVM